MKRPYLSRGHFEEAEQIQKALELDPTAMTALSFIAAHSRSIQACVQTPKHSQGDEAIAAYQRILEKIQEDELIS